MYDVLLCYFAWFSWFGVACYCGVVWLLVVGVLIVDIFCLVVVCYVWFIVICVLWFRTVMLWLIVLIVM